MNTVGELVRQRRERLGLTLAHLAGRVGATKGYLSMIENHRVANPPSPGVLGRLEAALGFSAGELRRAADWQRTPQDLRSRMVELEQAAARGRDLARWLRAEASRRKGGGKNLDKLYRSGQLGRRINQTLGDEPTPISAAVPMPGRVPLINKVAAGYPTGFTDLDYPARIADEYISALDLDDADAFAATVCGRSMLPDYREGDIIIFSPAAPVADGSDCFVRLEPDHDTTFKRVFFDEEAGAVRLQPLNPKFAPTTVPRETVAGLYRAVARYSRL